jgi:hypothetical protein
MRDIVKAAVGATGLGAVLPLTGGWLAAVSASHLELVADPSPARPHEVLTLLVAAVGAAVAAWLWLGLLLALLGHLPGALGAAFRHSAERVTPAAVRRVAAVLVGASLSGALAPGTATAGGPGSLARAEAPSPSFAVRAAPLGAPSPGFAPQGSARGAVAPVAEAASPTPVPGSASPGPVPGSASPEPVPGSASPTPGWTPTRPLVRPQPSPGLLTATPAPDERPGTVVRRGDTLWDVVRHHLGPDATDAEVAAEWPRWHAANRAVIGADPDLLLPGQVLHAPETVGAPR